MLPCLSRLGCTPRAAAVLIGGILIHLSIGSIYTFGNFTPYIISYLRNRTDDTSLRNVDAMWIITGGAVSNVVGMTSGGLLDKRFGPRIATAVGSIIYSGSHALTFFSIQKSFIFVVLTFGVTSLLGNVIAYGPTVQTAIKWFPNHPTLATGFILAGFGGGAMIFNQVITNFINPDNLPPDLIEDSERYFTDSDLLDRVPTCFLILGASYAAMQLIGIILIAAPPTDISVSRDANFKMGVSNHKSVTDPEISDKIPTFSVTCNQDKNSVVSVPKEENTQEICRKTEYTTKEAIKKMLRMRNFYIIWFSTLCGGIGIQFVLGLFKVYGQTFITDDRFLSLVGSFSSVFNCIGRPLWGVFIDRFKYKVSMCCISLGLVVFAGTFFTTEYTEKPGFFIWICLIFFIFSGIPALLPSTIAKLFGASNMAIVFGFIWIALSLAEVLGGIFTISLKAKVGWHGLFFLSAGLNFIPFILAFFFNSKDDSGKPI